MGEPATADEIASLMRLMREHGALELTTPAGIRIVLAPGSALPQAKASESDAEIAQVLSAEDRALEEEKRREREHYDRWSRITASSGAPIPPYRRAARVHA